MAASLTSSHFRGHPWNPAGPWEPSRPATRGGARRAERGLLGGGRRFTRLEVLALTLLPAELSPGPSAVTGPDLRCAFPLGNSVLGDP